MNRIRTILILLILFTCVFFGCGDKAVDNPTKPEAKKIKIVATIFPQYDWVKEIVSTNNSNIEVKLLINNGVDLHSYQPTAADIAAITQCDLLLLGGGESDQWVLDAVKETDNSDIEIINLLEVLGEQAKLEEIIVGMEQEPSGESSAPREYDEHVWLSLKNAAIICDEIVAVMQTIDPQNRDSYQHNGARYQEKLQQLDQRYQDAVASSKQKTVLFGDRFALRYLADDYGLKYYAAFPGCSAETEASFETIVFLANKIDELKLDSICVLESSDQSMATTIWENTTSKGDNILVFDSLQSVSQADVEAGATYLSRMEDNLLTLTAALQ
jgi:zinc transport system substrate-binding protein